MHPRCRSTISAVVEGGKRTAKVGGRNIRVPADWNYEQWRASLESGKNEIKLPQSNTTSTGKQRALEEVQITAEKMKNIVEKHVSRKSKWNGTVIESTLNYSYKHPACYIGAYLPNFPDEAILYEIIHSVSTDYYPNKLYAENNAIEEAAVQFLTREISGVEGITPAHSAYDVWVDILKDFNQKLRLYDSDLKFAKRLLRVPPNLKMNWLIAKAQKLKSDSIDELTRLIEPLYKIDWEELMNGRARINSKNP